MLSRVVVALLLLTIPSLAWADADPWGNVYPPECSREASIAAAHELTIIEVSNLPVKPGTESRCGFYDDRFDPPLIYLLKRCIVDGRQVAREVLEWHEGCHAIRDKLTGKPEWHP